MDLTNSEFALYLASWFGMMAGVWALFERAETVATKQTKTAVVNWINNLTVPDANKWPLAFRDIFERVFGAKHFSLRSFGMSLVSSVFFLVVMHLIWATLHPTNAALFFGEGVQSFAEILILGTLLNFLPDFISLFETRLILRRMARANSTLTILALIVIDVVLTGAIFIASYTLAFYALYVLAGVFAGLDLSGHWRFLKTGVFFDSPGWGTADEISMGPYIYTTFLTSVWIWLYVLSASVAKVFRFADRTVGIFRLVLDFKEKPIRSLGFISMLLVTLCYVLVPVVRML